MNELINKKRKNKKRNMEEAEDKTQEEIMKSRK